MTTQELLKNIEDLKLYRQSRVIRWQLRDYMFSENDSEHQLYVTQIIIYLSYILNIPNEETLLALKYGATHDYVESCSGVGDINYGIKQRDKELKDLVERLEENAMKSVESFYSTMIKCRENTISMKLVKLADAIDAEIYVRRELLFNKNTDEWLKLQKETQSRVNYLYNELKTLLNKKEE